MEPLPPSRLSRLLSTHGPTSRRGVRRLYARGDDRKLFGLTLRQLVGGKRWSLALVRFDSARDR